MNVVEKQTTGGSRTGCLRRREQHGGSLPPAFVHRLDRQCATKRRRHNDIRLELFHFAPAKVVAIDWTTRACETSDRTRTLTSTYLKRASDLPNINQLMCARSFFVRKEARAAITTAASPFLGDIPWRPDKGEETYDFQLPDRKARMTSHVINTQDPPMKPYSPATSRFFLQSINDCTFISQPVRVVSI